MEIEMDSRPTIKKPGQLKKSAQAPIGQAGRVHMNTKVNSERPGGTFKLPPAKPNLRTSWIFQKKAIFLLKSDQIKLFTSFWLNIIKYYHKIPYTEDKTNSSQLGL